MECCGACAQVAMECDCELCACGHCRHRHEKMRWHRVCRDCTPLAAADEIPNEIDTRWAWSASPPYPDWGAELDKHRPAGEPPLTCCAEHSAKIRALNAKGVA